MVLYRLEENPQHFIAPRYYGNKFTYQMARITGETQRSVIRVIDLRNDQLMIHGTEIKQSMLERLHQSLVLRPRTGVVYVNCIGECYFLVPGKGCYRPVDGAIFDWSPFGVVVPGSTVDSLRKEVALKEAGISRMKGGQGAVGLEASKEEIEELKRQLSACQKDKREMEEKLQRLSDQVSNDTELESHKIELELSKKKMRDLQEELSTCLEQNQTAKTELQKVKDHLSSMNSDLESSTTQLGLSKKRIAELEVELSTSKEERQRVEKELEKLENEISSTSSELESHKIELELSKKRMRDLQDELSTSLEESQSTKSELQTLHDQLSLVNSDLKSTTTQLELSKKRITELEGELSMSNEERQHLKNELEKLENELCSTKLELEYSKKQLESSSTRIRELEARLSSSRKEVEEATFRMKEVGGDELASSANPMLHSTKGELELSMKMVKELEKQLSTSEKEKRRMEERLRKMEDQLSMAKIELRSTKERLEGLEEEVEELNKGQSCACKADFRHVRGELHKISTHLRSVDSEVKYTNQKLDQMLISLLWNELDSYQQLSQLHRNESLPNPSDDAFFITVEGDPQDQ